MIKSRRNLYILSFVLLVIMLGYGMVIPILPFYVTEMGAGGTELGLLVATYALMRLICGPLWGSLSDRIGRKPILMIGILGYAVTMLWFGLATRLWMLFAARILSGILSSATAPSTLAYISDSTPEKERGMGMGMLGAAGGLGTILGPALSGFLADKSFAVPFFIAAILSTLAFILAWLILPESLPKEKRQVKKNVNSNLDVRLWLLTIRSPLGILFELIFLSTCGLMVLTSIFGLYTQAHFGFGPQEVGVMIMILGLMSALGQVILTGPLIARWGEKAVVRGSLLAAVLGFGLFILANGYLTIMIAAAVFGFVSAPQIPALTSLTSKNTAIPQGIAMGLSNSFISLGRIFGPLAAGFIFDLNSLLPLYLGSLLFGFGFFLSLTAFMNIKE